MNLPLVRSVQFSHSVMSDSVTPWTAELQASLSITNSRTNLCSLSQWCHPTVSSSIVPFSSCPKSFPATGSFQMSQLFASGGQSIGVSWFKINTLAGLASPEATLLFESSHGLFFACPCWLSFWCVQMSSYEDTKHSDGLVLTKSSLWRPCLHIQWHSEVLGLGLHHTNLGRIQFSL